jgi:SAM-dependent methyltransferase
LGADVTACDIGPELVGATVRRCRCTGVVADALDLVGQFGPNRFDAVVSSECIEHTPAPAAALEQMARVLKPGGWLAVSTPNRLWQPIVRAATWLRLRPFDGLEHFSTLTRIRASLKRSGVRVVRETGLHLWPFQLPLRGLSRWADENLQSLRGAMINLCVLGHKAVARPAGEPRSGLPSLSHNPASSVGHEHDRAVFDSH